MGRAERRLKGRRSTDLQARGLSSRVTQHGAWCTAGFQTELEKGMVRWEKRSRRRRRTTPELPDQVIAVRCQSAAERGGERGTCAGSEWDGTEKERQLRIKPPPLTSWWVGP